MKLAEVMKELKAMGNPQSVKTYRRHGADGPMFGVKIGDLKKIVRKIKDDQSLAMELWDTDNSDAMYLASLVADGSQMTKAQLNGWAKSAWWYMLSEYSVPFVAAEHKEATSIALRWINSKKKEQIASAGWSTYSLVVATRDDSELDLGEIRTLLKQVETEIESAPNRVRYCMNGFVISVGSYVKPLARNAKASAKRIGKVHVELGDTACKVPLATEAIEKVESMGRVGQKRQSVKC